tara:strand:- start:744 stop:1697 length:954 start_codon:yes stop_codon:yes gene_type:complete
MKNIYLNIFKFNKNTLFKTINYLKRNEIVGLPTETVYGLAGNAYSKKSVRKIYLLKKRPSINPLIIHYYDLKNISNDVYINDNFLKLYQKFCPGPITFIMNKKKNSKISSAATANLKTVAIRFPKNKITRKVLSKLNFPLAMPSANKSSGISPINALHVAEEFQNKVKLIINGGDSKIGIESTVVDLTEKINILRPGIITQKKISMFLKKKVTIKKKQTKIKSPGYLKKHYSPDIPMTLNQIKPVGNHAFIAFGKKFKGTRNIFNLSKKKNLSEAAKNLYKIFRKIKKLNYKKIYVSKIPNKGPGIAINDRLKHAAN